MKTLKQVEITPIYVGFIPEKLEKGKIYISKQFSTTSHLCLCGCGELVVCPLNNESHPSHGWTLDENGDKVTLSPSIGNYQLPCKSHYIITKNKANFV